MAKRANEQRTVAEQGGARGAHLLAHVQPWKLIVQGEAGHAVPAGRRLDRLSAVPPGLRTAAVPATPRGPPLLATPPVGRLLPVCAVLTAASSLCAGSIPPGCPPILLPARDAIYQKKVRTESCMSQQAAAPMVAGPHDPGRALRHVRLVLLIIAIT